MNNIVIGGGISGLSLILKNLIFCLNGQMNKADFANQ